MKTEVSTMKTDVLKQRLDHLLDEEFDHAQIRAKTSYDLAAGGFGDNIVLFGAGRFGRLVNRKLRGLRIHPIAFADNNPAIWGTRVDDVEVISPKEAAALYGQHAVFVVCVWNGEAHDRMADRIRQLKSLGCDAVISFGFLFWKHNEAFLPHYCVDLPQKVLLQKNRIRAAMQLWSDEYSREEFVAQVEFRILSNLDAIDRTVTGKHYFPLDLFLLGEDETFVDCGAFDGDTIADFIEVTRGSFRRIVAFEPDAVTYPHLQKRIQQFGSEIRNKIQLNQEAVGRKAGTISFEATGTMLSVVGSGSSVVSVAELDSSLASFDPTFIKFDVEGFEPEALMGASQLLSRTRPILAVSAYHQQSHLWSIPLLLSSLLPERYEFFLRPHGSESWDLVCYAIPAERVVLRA
jgi:FkbM family methyltransferase